MLDCVVSFVLYRTDPAEVVQAVEQALASGVKLRVIVVDNSVPPVALPSFDDARVRVVATGRNLGYGRGHNIAFAASAGEAQYHFVLNTDVRFGADALGALMSFMDANPAVGLAMPRIEYPDGRVQRLCRLLPEPLDLIGRRFFGWTDWAKRRNRKYEFHGWDYDRVASFPFLSGCFMAIRRAALDQVGGFDERYFLYAEDLDLSRRIHRVADTLFVPSVTATHLYRSERARTLRLLLHAAKSLAQYFTKWGWVFDHERVEINRRCVRNLNRTTAD